MPLALANEVTRLGNCPLDESVGEGFHRATNRTKAVASAARTPWVLGSVRHEANLLRCINFCNTDVEFSRKVFRFEWLRFKRILRGSVQKQWRVVKLCDQDFFKQLYNIVDNVVDWQTVVPLAAGKTTAVDAVVQSQYEYLRAVLQVGECYSVPRTDTEHVAEAVPEFVTKSVYCQVLSKLHGSSRPKVVEPSE